MEMTPKLKQAVKDYKSGKAESYEILYKESEKYIYTCIYKVMSGNNNALDITEEIMQETYLEIFLNISQLENEDRFLSWAGTIATRKCYAYIKKNKKYVLLNEDDDTFENLSDSDDIIPEEVMQNLEKRKLVRKIIDTQLTEVQKICIYEYYYNNRKQTEIAELYEMPLNTVKTNLSRAKAKVEEGVLDLEKKDGIRLHSFAPFFVLLFTEDVMAATVPAEVGASVMSTVADASVKMAETGASVSVGGATTSTVGTSSVTTTSVASKVGVLGKIAVASTKAKIIMAVATVSVVGTVGGGVMVASQNGLFGNTPTVNEQQETGDNQENDENQLTTETEEIQSTEEMTEVVEETEAGLNVIEVVELSGDCISGTETRYADGTSDYEIYYADPDINKTIHYRLTGVESNLVSSNWGGYCRAKRINRDENDNVVNSLCLYITIMTDETLSWASKPDEFFNSDTAGNATYDYSKFRRVETEKGYKIYSAGTRREFGGVENCKFYNVLIDDYATGRSFKIMLRGTPDYEYEQLLDMLDGIEIVEIIE